MRLLHLRPELLDSALRDHLLEHRVRTSGGHQLVFARPDGRPPNPSTINARATRAWERAGLEGLTLHEARHTFASLMIAAGVNIKALST